jgi:DamX protein
MTGNDNQTPSRLSEAALSDLGLSAQPFEDDRNRDLMNDSNSQSVRSEIEQQLKHGESLHLLIGPSGSGKSVLLSQLVRHNKDYLKPYIARGDSNFEARGFLAAILGQFDDQEVDTVPEHIERLIPHFETLSNNQTTPALIVDNAHLAPIEEIAELIGLMPSLQQDGRPVARLLLTGVASFQDELDAVGGEFDMPNYSVSAMPALTPERTREYLAFRLNQAGFVGEFPFTDNAVTRIQQNADGIPAAINQHAATYLNKVYTGTGVAASSGVEGGLIGALGWPVIGLGAAALALIVWGLSMFGSSDSGPDDTLAAIDNDTTTPVVATPASPQVDETSIATSGSGADLLRPEHRDAADSDSPAQSSTEETPSTGTLADGSSAADTELLQPQTDPAGSDTQTDTSENTLADNSAGDDTPAAPAIDQTTTASAGNGGNRNTNPGTTEETAASGEDASTTEEQPVTAAAEPEPEPVQPAPVQPAPPAPATTETQSTASSVVVPVPSTDTDAASVPAVSDGTSDDGVPVEVEEPEVQRVVRAVENERWVLFQPQTKFTLQLATSRERDYIMEFAQTLPLDGPLAVYPFVIKSNGRQVYGLLNGLFDSTDEALAAINAMPAEVRQFKPWIRPIKQLQDEIKNGQ